MSFNPIYCFLSNRVSEIDVSSRVYICPSVPIPMAACLCANPTSFNAAFLGCAGAVHHGPTPGRHHGSIAARETKSGENKFVPNQVRTNSKDSHTSN